jgi:hypothetical protein
MGPPVSESPGPVCLRPRAGSLLSSATAISPMGRVLTSMLVVGVTEAHNALAVLVVEMCACTKLTVSVSIR